MSDQSVGPKTPAPRREVWDHIGWGVGMCGMPIPEGVQFINEDRPDGPLIVVLKVSSPEHGEEWRGYLELHGRDSNKNGVFHYGEVLGWRWHVDFYGSLTPQVAQQNLPQTAEVVNGGEE